MVEAKTIKLRNKVVYSKNRILDFVVLNNRKPIERSKRRSEKLPNIALSVPNNVCSKGAIYRFSDWSVKKYVFKIFKTKKLTIKLR